MCLMVTPKYISRFSFSLKHIYLSNYLPAVPRCLIGIETSQGENMIPNSTLNLAFTIVPILTKGNTNHSVA